MHLECAVWPFNRRLPKGTPAPVEETPREVRELLDLLGRLTDRSRDRLSLNPPVTSEALSAYEQQHSVNLPSVYRNFLRYAGNGGAGPGFGLIPLELAGPQGVLPEGYSLSTPFHHTSSVTVKQYAHVSDSDPFWEAHYYTDRLISGCLRLADAGCGRGYLLVVNGPTAGTVWFDDRDTGIYALDVTFNSWLRDWLESEIRATMDMRAEF